MTRKMIQTACLGLIVVMASSVPAWAASFPALAGEVPDDAVVRLIYNAGDGTFGGQPATGKLFTSLNVQIEETSLGASPPGFTFFGDRPVSLSGAFDNFSDDNLFIATFGENFGTINFGQVLQPGLSKESLLAHLTIDGSYDGGGDLGDVYLQYVPEPSTVILMGLGLMGLLAAWRRR